MRAEHFLVFLGPLIVVGLLASYTALRLKGIQISKFIILIFCFSGLGLSGLGLNMSLNLDVKNMQIIISETESLIEAYEKNKVNNCESKRKALDPFIKRLKAANEQIRKKGKF